MDSPEGNRIPDSSLSMADEESPTSNYFSSLSPIQSKAVRSMQIFSETNLPSQLPAFTSPHIDLKRESSLLKRDRINAACSDAYEQCDTRLKTDLIPCIEKQVQTHCPSGRVDEFLADPVEVNCMNSADLHSQPDNDFPQQSQTDFIGPKEPVKAVYDANISSKETGVPTLSDQAEHDLPLRSVILAETADNERFDEIIELASENFQDLVEHDISVDPVSRGQKYKQYVDQVDEAYEGFDKSSRPTSESYVKDINKHQQGTRRHLQFEAAKSCMNTITGTSHYHTNSKSPTIVTAMGRLIPYNFEPRGISSIRKPDSYARTITPQPSFCSPEYFRSTQNDRNSAISVPFPSGDSLHLKRICESVSMDLDTISSKKPAECWSSQEQKLVLGRSYNLANDINCGSQSADKVEELNQVSPDRKRKRLKYSCEIDEGCKNCHCKKSKCLKLYCECFAAGIYCVDSCGCSNCFNKPDYEDSVLEAREQIESRNPLAFVSKVVQHDTDSPANVMDDGNWTTPSSSRHRKGCNCKKSKCLKKYCECYQANVGCSDGCRCEDCRNSFGKKPVSISLLPGNSGVAETACKKDTTLENTYSEKMDTSETGKDDQFSPTWEGLADINHLYQLLETTDAAKASEAQLNQAPDSSLHQQSSPEMSTPTKAAQASSLSQKQASPPQIRLQEPRSTTSRGLISGRKFTLQDVPSFPPLTPRTESKDGIKPD